jgi:altronate dehydratase large subunit
MHFYGYLREDGSYGVRNYVVIVSSVVCANGVVEEIGRQVPGVVPIAHTHGCGGTGEIAMRTLSGLGQNPNVASLVVIGLGCEESIAPDIANAVAKTGKWVEYLVIQNDGGTAETAKKGAEIAEKMLALVEGQKRVEAALEHLTVGLECGGSDAFSGISANPAVGVTADLVVAEGGTVILSELSEMVGTSHLLKRRAANAAVAEKIEAYVALGSKASTWYATRGYSGALAPGNVAGGLTNIVEKSLGCIAKGGSSTITDCLPYAVKASTKGLVIMETAGYDIESVTGMVAGGAQVVIFTTGCGSPAGSPLAPVIKVVSNSNTYKKMPGDFDINAGSIIDSDKTIKEVGREIFELLVDVASGKQTKAEINKQYQFAIRQEGFQWPTLRDIAHEGRFG